MDAVSETLDDGLLQFNPGNFTGTGGFVDTPNQRLVIRHVPPVVGVEDLPTSRSPAATASSSR